jgi:hypothetical protein
VVLEFDDGVATARDFEALQQPELGESKLSQRFESHHLSDQSSHAAISLPTVDQIMLVREMLPSIPPCLGGSREEHLKSQGKRSACRTTLGTRRCMRIGDTHYKARLKSKIS